MDYSPMNVGDYSLIAPCTSIMGQDILLGHTSPQKECVAVTDLSNAGW
jgi:hypothetical protein